MSAPVDPPDSSAAGSEAAASIAAGYSFTGPVLEFGTVVLDGGAHADARIRVPLAMTNRHGLIAGATGTGKTKTLQGLAEQLSAAGVPVVVADVKGDLSGLSAPGEASERVAQRAAETADTDWAPTAFPVEFAALGGIGSGVPLRATMTAFGPTLLAKVLDLNATQESSLNLIFHYADRAGLPLLDLKDLRAVIGYLTSAEGKADLAGLGGLSKATAGVILRALIGLEDHGGDTFFGEPEFETTDLLRTAPDGRGVITAIELADLQDRPALFSTFLMWLLADLFHELPEIGDADKPRLVFLFDEAHLLFADASKAFLQSVTQTVRLIRSKGVGIFFVTQNPQDVPDDVLGQLGNRVQHALRAFTPDDASALAKAVKTYPKTANYDLSEALQQLGTGEAIVTVLAESGAPTPVAWVRMRPPRSLMAQVDPAGQQRAVAASPLQAKYGQAVDRDSAYERLAARLEPAATGSGAGGSATGGSATGLAAGSAAGASTAGGSATGGSVAGSAAGGSAAAGSAADGSATAGPAPAGTAPVPPTGSRETKQAQPAAQRASKPAESGVEKILGSPAFRSFTRSAATVLGREITRGIFGTRKR